MQLQSNLSLVGTPKIWIVYPDGSRKLHWEEKNLITLSAKQVMMASLYLSGQVSDPINKCWVGTGGTIDPNGQFPKTVAQSATNLFTPLIGVATTYTIDNTTPAVTFIADIDQGTAVGSLISEVGLFKTSGLMFNIKTFPGIPKTADFSIHFEWTIDIA